MYEKNNRSRYQLFIQYVNPLQKVGNKQQNKRVTTKNNSSKKTSDATGREKEVKKFFNMKTLAKTC